MEYIDTIEALLGELEAAREMLPDYGRAYDCMSLTLQKYLNQQTSFNTLRLVGTFAKMDYLLKERHASQSLVRSANNARTRLRKRYTLTRSELEQWMDETYTVLRAFIGGETDLPLAHPTTSQYTDTHDDTEEDYLRVIVDAWDEQAITCHDEKQPDQPIRVSYIGTGSNFDLAYIRPLLYPRVQLNLIRPRPEDGMLRAQYIILEPDFLVDISAIAACFESYAESPLIYMLGKIKPAPCSDAILLGNFASQMLDEQLHASPDHNASEAERYKQSAQTFFQNYPLKLLTTSLPDDFHAQARLQMAHIQRVVDEVLPQRLGHFDIRQVMVEPSFFCEMLGLQGRMDLLQLDHRLLIEQKAGKGGWPQPDADTPVAKEQHYVQMLLYMMLLRYNFRTTYEANNRELQAFLLYSKYPNSLLGLGYSPDLVDRALRIRNGIVWLENHLTQGGSTLLDHLTPEALNKKGDRSPLWTQYTQPQLQALLDPIHAASPLERAYFHRMMTFVATEHMLEKLGNKTKESSGFASKWHDALAEKLQAGNIIHQLRLHHTTSQEVTLLFEDNENHEMANFRQGDIVILYPYPQGAEPDLRQTMVFRGSIADITSDMLTIRLRAAQTDAHVFTRSAHMPWAIEHDLMEASQASLSRGLYAFLCAPQERRDLLMMQREPRIDTSLTLKGEYGAFDALSLKVKQARDLYLIIGPPGTGKTSFGMLNTLKEQLLEEATSVLVLSYTNRAVDEICSKLVEEGIDFLRISSEANCPDQYRPHLLKQRMADCTNLSQVSAVVMTPRVVVGTAASLSSNLELFRLRQFALAVVDEASQILEPQLMALLAAQHEGKSAIAKFVMIGDHKQLPAVVQQQPEESRVTDPLLLDIGLEDCRQSLFERLLRRYRHNPQVVHMLTRQGRMHHDIAHLPSQHFYEGQLTEVPLPHQTAELTPASHHDDPLEHIVHTARIAFIDVPPPGHFISDKVNMAEADIIRQLVSYIYNKECDHFDPLRTVGIIVPYRNQIAAIRGAIDQLGIPELHGITIDTVERYQGSQRKHIIYGFTIQRHYQLNFLTSNTFMEEGRRIDRRLNVAMTRAEEQLIMVGNRQLLSADPTFRAIIDAVVTDLGN